jgi:hypothetical protein
VTILAVRQLLTLHFFLGMLLIGPVLLKQAPRSTGSSGTTPGHPITGARARPSCRCACWARSSC